jgi:phosphate:Na+ symporter
MKRFRWPYESKTVRVGLLVTAALMLLGALPSLAAAPGEHAINWLTLLMKLFGGLAMFLYGMEQMSEGLKAAAGDTLKDVLARLTKNRVMGALTGAFVTAVLNSSSVTTVLVVGFISAGFMTLAQSIGIIMGANIGSTFTAQIVAFNVTQYALIMVATGFFMLFTGKQEKIRHYGSMIMGLGLVFYGMGVMGEGMAPLRSYPPFIDLMARMENPLLGILVGAVFTGLVQSSAATTGIAIVMAAGGLITLPAGIALAFGANIGTCVTALLAAIGKPTDAVRAAMVHIVFNVANTLLFLGFTTHFARLVERLVPARPEAEKIIVQPRYLDTEMITIPAMALERVRFEIGHMGEIITEMLSRIDEGFLGRDKQKLDEVMMMDDKVDVLNEAILEYLGEVRQQPLTDHQSDEFQRLMSATLNLESLADIIEGNLVNIGREFIDQDLHASETSRLLLREFADQVTQAVFGVIRSICEKDETAAAGVIALKDEIRRLADEALRRQSERIAVPEPQHLKQVQLEMELLENLRRIYTLAKRVAKDFVPDEIAGNA